MDFSKQAIKNLFSKPATSNYPFTPKEYPERSRGHIEINIDDCIMCGMCMRKCPSVQSRLTEINALGLLTEWAVFNVQTVLKTALKPA